MWGAWLLAALLCAPGAREEFRSAWLGSAGGPSLRALEPCEHPRELEGEAGATRRVGCADPAAGRALRGPARVLFGLGIDPNAASPTTLEALPGVGPARAAAIVAGREVAPYRQLADLARVPGIGAVTLRRIGDWLTFPAARSSGPSAEPAPRRPSSGTGSLPTPPWETPLPETPEEAP